jgi:ABC-2 type transport system permease protein
VRTFWYRDVLKLERDRGRLLTIVIQPLLFLVLFGVGFARILGVNPLFRNLTYIQFIFPGIIGVNLLGLSVSQGVGVTADKQFGFLKEVLVAPVSRYGITFGKLLGGMTQGLFQLTIVMLFTPIVGLRLTAVQVVLTYVVGALLALAATALGILIASKARSTESFQFIFQAAVFPIFFISGTFFPVTEGPLTHIWGLTVDWLLWLSRLSPLTYTIDLLRHILYYYIVFTPFRDPATGATVDPRSKLILYPVWLDISVLVASLILLVLFATRSFKRTQV